MSMEWCCGEEACCRSDGWELVEAWHGVHKLAQSVYIWTDRRARMRQHQFGVHSSMTAALNDHGYLRELSRP